MYKKRFYTFLSKWPWSCDLKSALPFTLDIGNLSWKSDCCMVFHFRVNGKHRRYGQTADSWM